MPPTSGPAGTVLYDVPDTNHPGSAADRVAAIVGSWPGPGWTSWPGPLGSYPCILMNRFLSLQVACTAPMLMMSQNRLAAREGLSAQDEALAKIVEALAARQNGAAQG